MDAFEREFLFDANSLGRHTDAQIERALEQAERKGFTLAMIGRALAIGAIAISSLWGYYFPTNIIVFGATGTVDGLGLVTFVASGTCFEKTARFALFAFDAIIITVLLVFAPLSSGDTIPQNLMFLTSRVQSYYIVIAAAVLTLSPALVIWTGLWSMAGLIFAVLWIVSGMEDYLSYSDLPPAPSREIYFHTILNPNFIGLSSRIQEVLIIGAVTGITALAVRRARGVVGAHASAEASRQRVQNLFGQYIPNSVIQELLDEGHLTPQTRQATVLFVDIEGFTTIAEAMPPSRLVPLLNELFSAITDIVEQQGGVVINYIGDAVIASFNAPVLVPGHADRAIEASRTILEQVEGKSYQGLPIHLRLGIATGSVVGGTVGSRGRQTYTLYGDTVNMAQRLEALNKEFGTRCLISQTTVYQASQRHDQLVSLGIVSIRNRRDPVQIFKHVSDGSLSSPEKHSDSQI